MALPDGTFVHLNAATNLEYDVNNSKQRLVKLSGEAFFDVAKNPDCPFKVIINDLQIEVVGTCLLSRGLGDVYKRQPMNIRFHPDKRQPIPLWTEHYE